jgi:uncharacterized surface protein with fasciclin (FAS1) repeats
MLKSETSDPVRCLLYLKIISNQVKQIIMQSKFLSAILSMMFLSILFTSCGGGEAAAKKVEETATKVVEAVPVVEAPKTVVDVAIGSPDHSTLVAAVTAAGLVETLKGAGPFTIFAPTNAAFTALPAGTVDGLLKPESKAALTGILTYHVVSGNVKAADLKDGQKVKTLNGGELTVSIKEGKVKINGANVTAADLAGSNGVIHVVDGVLLPKK